jgi:hypothetical protein
MKRLARHVLACSCALGLLATIPQPASADGYATGKGGATSATSEEAWNCREVIAATVTFFRTSTGHDTIAPHVLYAGWRFRSHGVSHGRYHAESWGPVHYLNVGWVTADSRWVRQLPDSDCY